MKKLPDGASEWTSWRLELICIVVCFSEVKRIDQKGHEQVQNLQTIEASDLRMLIS